LSAPASQVDSFHIESHAVLLCPGADAVGPASEPAGSDPTGPEPARLQRAMSQPPRRLDAIVVPTIRPWSLGTAIALAGEIGCALVVLCSTPEQAAQATIECAALATDVLVSYVSADRDSTLPLLTAAHPESDIVPSCHADIARKRNVGLLLARLCAWDTIMFLDDDIRDVTPGLVSGAAALTAHCQAAGFKIGYYPDNSVVCHAHRLVGGAQDVFPGGGALLVDVVRADALFPPIYNDDWLFLFAAAQLRSVVVAGTLSQLPYHPFARPGRAASEEFGDVIAEGLYRLLHEGADATDATRRYWRAALHRRSRLIDHIADRLLLQHEDAPKTRYALTSLAAARKRLADITEFACLSYIRAWQADLEIWREKLTGIPALADLAGAAEYLNLPVLDRCVNQ
jgi:hypothetical protein